MGRLAAPTTFVAYPAVSMTRPAQSDLRQTCPFRPREGRPTRPTDGVEHLDGHRASRLRRGAHHRRRRWGAHRSDDEPRVAVPAPAGERHGGSAISWTTMQTRRGGRAAAAAAGLTSRRGAADRGRAAAAPSARRCSRARPTPEGTEESRAARRDSDAVGPAARLADRPGGRSGRRRAARHRPPRARSRCRWAARLPGAAP